MTDQEQKLKTEARIKAIKVSEKIKLNREYRDRSLDEIREDSQETPLICQEFFDTQGTRGFARLMESILATGDKNAISFFDTVSTEKGMEVVTAYGTLIATDGATNGNENLTEYEAMQAFNLYHSEKMNNHVDSPFKQDPKFDYQLQATGNVIVGDEIVVEEGSDAPE